MVLWFSSLCFSNVFNPLFKCVQPARLPYMEEAVRRQDAVISKQDDEMKRLNEQLEEMERQMVDSRQENADLVGAVQA